MSYFIYFIRKNYLNGLKKAACVYQKILIKNYERIINGRKGKTL